MERSDTYEILMSSGSATAVESEPVISLKPLPERHVADDMAAFRKGRVELKLAEDARAREEREAREKATALILAAQAREHSAYSQVLQRTGKLRLRAGRHALAVLAHHDRTERHNAGDKPSQILFGALGLADGQDAFFLDILVRCEPEGERLTIRLGHDSKVSGKRVAPKGLLQEWENVEAFMQALIHWAVSVPEIQAC